MALAQVTIVDNTIVVSAGGSEQLEAYVDAAAAFSNQAQAAAEASGVTYKFYDTKADATADLASIPANAVIEVFVDEGQSNNRTRYRKESGVLVFKVATLDADLQAIANLTSAANKMPYATGSGTWALTDLTSFARTLLATASNSAFLTALGQIASSFVNFIQSGTGAVTETVQTALRRTIYTSQYASVQDAINAVPATGGVLEFPAGATITLTSTLVVNGKTNIKFRGNGATVRSGATRLTNGYFEIYNSSNVIFEGFTFDGRQADMPVYTQADYDINYNAGIICNGLKSGSTPWSNILVRDCVFANLYTVGLYCYTGNGVIVENCVFSALEGNQTNGGSLGAQQFSFIYLQTVGGIVDIENNAFNGATTTSPAASPNAVFMSGITGVCTVAKNYSNYCGRNNAGNHRLGVYDLYGDGQNVSLLDNVSDNTMSQFSRLSSGRNLKAIGNRVTMSANAELDYSTISIESTNSFSHKGVQDAWICNNTFIDLSGRAAFTTAVLSYDWGTPATHIHILNNDFQGCRRPVYVSGPFFDVTIEGNKSRAGNGTIEVVPGAGITAGNGTEANSTYDRLFVRNNSLYNPTSGSNAGGIEIKLNTATTAYVGLIEVRENVVRGVLNGGQGIVVQSFSSTRANSNAIARDNFVQGYTYNYYIRDGGGCVYENNRSLNAGTAPLLYSPGDMLYFNASGNRYGVSGALVGSATLVAGTVTVSTDEIRTGDTVQLTRKSIGGTAGNITLGTITNATSFVINSDNAADTSVVFWEIVH